MRIAVPAYAAAPGGTTLVLRVDDMPAQTRCCYGPGVHEVAFALGPGRLDASLLLKITASPPFVPIERGVGPDTRRLTVLLRSFTPLDPHDRFLRRSDEAGGSSRNLFIALAGGIIAGIAACKRPRFAWLLFLLSDPFLFAYGIAGTTVTLPKLVLLGAIVGILSRRDARAALRDFGVARGIFVPFALFLGSLLLSDIVADSRGAAWRETLKMLQFALTCATAFLAYRLDRDDKLLFRVMAGLVSCVALLALAQVRYGAPEATIIAGHIVPRVGGPLEGPNQLAAFLAFALPLVAVEAFSRKPALPALAAFALGVFALLATISRSGILSAVLTMTIFFVVRRNPEAVVKVLRVCTGLGGAIAASMLAAVCGVRVFVRAFGGEGDPYAGGLGNRVELWRGAGAMWRTHPWLGVGPGNYELRIGEMIPGVATHANGYYLHVLAEQGVIGLFAFSALTVGAIGLFARGVACPLVLAVFAALLGLAEHQLVDGFLLYTKIGVSVWTLVGIAAATFVDSKGREG